MNPWEKKAEKAVEKVAAVDPVKIEPIKTESVPDQPGDKVNMLVSETDAFILDRLRSQPKTLEDLDVQVISENKAGKHRLSLPEELEVYKDRYAFCWIFKRKQSIDEACDIYHWVICNRSHFSDVADKAPHVFTARGVIERGDEILMFRKKEIDEMMRKAPGIESAQRIKNRFEAHKNDPNYYTPDSDEYEVGADGKKRKIPVVGV